MASESAPASPPPAEATYVAKESIQNAAVTGAQAAGVGLLVSAVQNALDTHNRGAAGVITRSGGTIAFFAGMGATFTLAENVTANFRQTDDPINGAAGGCAAGFLAGLRARSIPVAVASCAVIGGLVGAMDTAGGRLTGDGRDQEDREAKDQRRANFFKQPKPEPESVGSSS